MPHDAPESDAPESYAPESNAPESDAKKGPSGSGRVSLPAILLCLGTAFVLGVQIPAAKLAFEQGADPTVLALFRSVLAVVLFLPMVLIAKVPLRLPRSAWGVFGLSVAGATVVSYGYLSAVELIPASLAAMMFYLFPLLILFGESVRTRRSPSWPHMRVALLAFVGLGLVYGPSFEGLNLLGVAMAVMAAVGAAFYITYLPALSALVDTRVAVLWMNVVITLAMIPAVLLSAGSLSAGSLSIDPGSHFGLPQSGLGWLWFAIAGVTFSIGIAMSFPAIRHAGAVTAALLLNFEPVVIVALSALFLGEVLGISQYLGVAVVIGAMAMVGRIGRTRRSDC